MASTWADLLLEYGTFAIWRMQEPSGGTAARYGTLAAPDGAYTTAGTNVLVNQTGNLFESGNKSVLLDRTLGDNAPRVQIADNATLNLGAAFSAGCWFKYTGASVGDRRLLCNRDASDRGYELVLTDLGASFKYGAVFGGASVRDCTGATNTLTYNAWHFVCTTYDGATLKNYVDGTVDPTSYSFADTIADSNYNLYIGGSQRFSQHVTAYMHHAFIGTTVLTATQVSALYAAGTAGTGLSSGGSDDGYHVTTTAMRYLAARRKREAEAAQ